MSLLNSPICRRCSLPSTVWSVPKQYPWRVRHVLHVHQRQVSAHKMRRGAPLLRRVGHLRMGTRLWQVAKQTALHNLSFHPRQITTLCLTPRDDCDAAAASEPKRKKKKGSAPVQEKKPDRKPAEKLANGFVCPGGPIGVHPALPHPDDCRLYYVCLNGLDPSDAGCPPGKVFNPTIQQCDLPANVNGESLFSVDLASHR